LAGYKQLATLFLLGKKGTYTHSVSQLYAVLHHPVLTYCWFKTGFNLLKSGCLCRYVLQMDEQDSVLLPAGGLQLTWLSSSLCPANISPNTYEDYWPCYKGVRKVKGKRLQTEAKSSHQSDFHFLHEHF